MRKLSNSPGRCVPVALINVILQQEVTVPKQTPEQFWVGIGTIVILAALGVFIWSRTDFSGLPKPQQRRKSRVRTQENDRTPLSLRIPAGEDVHEYVDAIRDRVLAVEQDGDEADIDERMSWLRAAAEAKRELGTAWDPVLSFLPRRARQAFELGILLAVFGAIAVSTGQVVAWLQQGKSFPGWVALASRAVDITFQLVDTATTVLTLFPYGDAVWGFGFAYSLLLWEFLYNSWAISAGTLIAAGLLLTLFDWRRDRDDDVELIDRNGAALAVVFALVTVWACGVIPVVFGALVGATHLGAFVGFLAALLALLVFLVGGVAGLLQDILWVAGAGVRFPRAARFRPSAVAKRVSRRIFGFGGYGTIVADQTDARDPDWALAGSILVERAISVLGGVLSVVLLAYLVVAVADGRFLRVFSALVTAPLDTKLLIAVLIVGPIAMLGYQIRAVWPDLKTAMAETWARRRVQAALVQRGIPTVAVVLAAIVIQQITESLVFAALGGVGVGLGAALLIAVLMQSQYRMAILGGGDPQQSQTLLQIYPPIEDGDDGEQYFAVVDGNTRVLWPDREQFVEDVLSTAEAVRTHGEQPNTLGVWHAKRAFDLGLVDVAGTKAKVEERARKKTFAPLRKNDRRMEEDELQQKLAAIPDGVCEQRWDEWFRMGILQRRGDYIVLMRDPWSKGAR